MPFESYNYRKWWHATLDITTSDATPMLLSRISSYSPADITINALPNNVLAYFLPDQTSVPLQIDLPIPAFDIAKAPGMIVYKPTVAQLMNSFFVANTIEDVYNTANRRTFTHYINAAYDINDITCSSTSPNTLDSGVYYTEEDQITSIVCVFPNLPAFAQKFCCSVLATSETVPLSAFYDQTVLFVLTSELLPSDYPDQLARYKYRIYEYDYALLGTPDALALMATSETDVNIYDITVANNKIFAITNLGFCEIQFQYITNDNVTYNKVFVLRTINTLYQNDLFNQPTEWYLLNRRGLFTNEPCTIEFVPRTNNFYINASPTINTGTVLDSNNDPMPANSNITPTIFECTINLQSATIGNNRENSQIPKTFARPSTTTDDVNENRFFGIFDKNLVRFSSFGEISYINQNNIFTSINALAFVKNPDELIRENTLLATNVLGQIFVVNFNNATLTTLPDTIPYEVSGITSTIGVTNFERLRYNPFPFSIITTSKHWMFIVDCNNAAALEIETKIKPSFLTLISTFVRQNDKITLIFFSNRIIARQTFVIRLLSDITTITSFINDNYISDANQSNMNVVLSTVANEYRDVESIYIIGKANYADIQYFTGGNDRFVPVKNSITSIATANSRSVFTFVQVGAGPQFGVAAIYNNIIPILTESRRNVYTWII